MLMVPNELRYRMLLTKVGGWFVDSRLRADSILDPTILILDSYFYLIEVRIRDRYASCVIVCLV